MSTRQVARQVGRGGGRAESAGADRGSVRPRDSLFHWCGTADAIRQAADRREKRVLLQAYFGVVAAETMPPAARFFSELPFSHHHAGATPIDASMVKDAIREITRLNADKLRALVARCGGIGEAAADLFSGRLPSGLSVNEVADWVDELADASAETAHPAPAGHAHAIEQHRGQIRREAARR